MILGYVCWFFKDDQRIREGNIFQKITFDPSINFRHALTLCDGGARPWFGGLQIY